MLLRGVQQHCTLSSKSFEVSAEHTQQVTKGNGLPMGRRPFSPTTGRRPHQPYFGFLALGNEADTSSSDPPQHLWVSPLINLFSIAKLAIRRRQGDSRHQPNSTCRAPHAASQEPFGNSTGPRGRCSPIMFLIDIDSHAKQIASMGHLKVQGGVYKKMQR